MNLFLIAPKEKRQRSLASLAMGNLVREGLREIQNKAMDPQLIFDFTYGSLIN